MHRHDNNTWGEPPASPAPILAAVRARLEAQGRELRGVCGDGADPAAVRSFVRSLDGCLADLNRAAGFAEDQALLVRQSLLQGCFPVLLLHQQGETQAAWRLLLGLWRQIAEAFGARVPFAWFSEIGEPAVPYLAIEQERVRGLLAALHEALSERI